MSATQRCPRCGSYNTSTSIDYKIKKGLGYVAEFGIGFLAGRYLGDAGVAAVEDVTIADGVEKEWQCDACGHKWRASEQKHESTFSNNPSSPNNTKLVHAKPKPALKSPSHSSSPSISQQKQYNKHDRAKLLEIIYISDGRHNNWKDEHAPIQNNTRLFEELQKHSINVSKSVISSVNTYKRLADKILDRGWTYAAYQTVSTQAIESAPSSNNTSNATNEQEYLDELKECLADGNIGSGERRLLNKLRSKLGISEERAAELEASLRKPQLTAEEQEYLEAYKEVVEDGAISEKERRLLNKLIKMYNISETRAKEIEEMAHK